ncbi:MAG TPA: HlyD family type I secretion periplasmic adaptor subunit, partial [Burkholderiales bacterium]|nr:HlyD family type I secretion periplasmic adaptor subunit [Burkholderiales bacterium]
GAWSASAPLSGAVIAPALLKVELNRKTVQHQEGGIVREILVRDGQKVRAGDPLVVIGDVRSDSMLRLLQDQLAAERMREARAAAEAALAPRFAAPADARESTLFVARRRILDEQLASLEAQIREAQAQAGALQAQIDAAETSARLSAEELEMNERLARQGFVHRTRLLGLQRTEADYRAKVGEHRSELAAARQRMADLKARIAQARNLYQSQAADELRDASTKVRDLEERLRPSQDQVERQIVRSPVDGEVMGLRVSAAGAVIGPREPILDVVPGSEKLVVEARIRPQDIDHVRKDAPAEVRLLNAFDARTAPLVRGKVVFVSADRVKSPDGADSWFAATVELEAAELARYPGLRLQAGMPAELYVTTPSRTLLAYLARPLELFASRALREP